MPRSISNPLHQNTSLDNDAKGGKSQTYYAKLNNIWLIGLQIQIHFIKIHHLTTMQKEGNSRLIMEIDNI